MLLCRCLVLRGVYPVPTIYSLINVNSSAAISRPPRRPNCYVDRPPPFSANPPGNRWQRITKCEYRDALSSYSEHSVSTAVQSCSAARDIIAYHRLMNADLIKVFQRPIPKVLSNECPTCGARPNEACELTTGQPRTEPHIDRRLAANRSKRKAAV